MIKWQIVERSALYVAVLASAVLATWIYANHKMVEKQRADNAYNSQEVAQILQMEKTEDALNVGKAIPEGIVVKDRDGKDVDVRSMIHGPTILIKIAMDCEACQDTLTWLRQNASTSELTQHATVIVLAIRAPTRPIVTLPPNVQFVYTPEKLASGFLGGSLTPAEFIFDSHGMLVARRSGFSPDMQSKLAFPGETTHG